MNVIDEQRDSITLALIDNLATLLPSFHKFMIKLDQKKDLVPDIREEMIVSDEVEDVRSSQTKEVCKRLAGLPINDVSRETKVAR